MFVLKLPPVPKCCARCSRTLDGKVGSPFGCWAVPNLNGATGVTLCGYCYHVSQFGDPLAEVDLPASSKAACRRYLASK